MEEKTLKPRIRFKGFTEAWEQREAKELCSITTGKSNTQDQVEDGKYIFFIRSDVPVRSNRYLFDEEAVITIGDGNIGRVFHYVNGKFDLHQRCYKMSDFRYLTAKYFYYFFSTKFYDRAMSMTAKATVDSVRLEMISDMDIRYPKEFNEQNKISAFLNNVDSLITLHQRKFEKLTQIKKSLLEKMFPADGANTPKIRFKGFNEAWEQRKVSEIAYRFDGQRVPVAESKRIEGNTPYYGANGIQDFVEGYTHEGEFVLVAEDGANDLKNYPVQYVNGRIWVNNHAHVLQANEQNYTMFLKYLINSTNMESVLVGGGRAKLNANVLMDLNFCLPKKNEQKSISSLLYNLESVITLHQRKCEKLKNIKKSLLEKMFV